MRNSNSICSYLFHCAVFLATALLFPGHALALPNPDDIFSIIDYPSAPVAPGVAAGEAIRCRITYDWFYEEVTIENDSDCQGRADTGTAYLPPFWGGIGSQVLVPFSNGASFEFLGQVAIDSQNLIFGDDWDAKIQLFYQKDYIVQIGSPGLGPWTAIVSQEVLGLYAYMANFIYDLGTQNPSKTVAGFEFRLFDCDSDGGGCNVPADTEGVPTHAFDLVPFPSTHQYASMDETGNITLFSGQRSDTFSGNDLKFYILRVRFLLEAESDHGCTSFLCNSWEGGEEVAVTMGHTDVVKEKPWDKDDPLAVINPLRVDNYGDDADLGYRVDIEVIVLNSPPVADNDAYNGTEDTVLNVAAASGVLNGDTDVDGNPLTAFKDSNPGNGSVTLNANGSFSYTPNANFCGPDSFTYHANDGTANSNIATVSISVACVNDAPSFTKGANQSVLEDAGLQTVAVFAVAAPGGGADEAGQTFTYNVSNSNNALFSAQPAISPAGTLTYTPAADANGSATVTVAIKDNGGIANGGVDTSAGQTFSIAVTAVNDEPSFTHGGNQSVPEDAGAQSVAGWATGLSVGPANEAGQTLSFIVSNDNNALFSAQPAISPAGTLTYTPAADANGSATVTVAIKDNGGIANGGVDTSAGQTFSIAVTAVNDEPSFTHGGNQSVPEDSGLQTVAVFAVAAPGGGADEAGQTFTYNVSNSNNALFSAQPAISPAGTLTYTSALNAFGTATVTASVTDSGGTDNGGDDTSPAQSFDIEVTPVNDAPVATDDSYTVDEDTQLTGNVIADDTGGGADSDVDGDGLSISSNTDVSHGTLVLNGDGSFTYDPNLNYCGSDSFTYVITDDPPLNGDALTSNTATVSITVTCVNDPPTVESVGPAAQTSDYSDDIGTVIITVEDVDDTSTTLQESEEPPLSDAGLALTSTGCLEVETESPAEQGSICTWTYDGQVLDPGDNVWTIVFTPSDGGAEEPVTGTHELTIQPEDATVTLDGGNPVAVEVAEPDGDSGEFLLHFSADEMLPDLAGLGSAQHGDLGKMVPYMELAPVGPGGVEPGVCDFFPPAPDSDDEYDQVAYFECVFDDVPVNTYQVIAWVDGAGDKTRYYFGGDDGVLVIYDPSLGFTTGGGWFYWPGTADPELSSCGEDGYPGDKTNFGYNMKYNKKMTKVQGSLLLQRHTVDANCEGAGKYRVKSNVVNGLSIGDGTDADGDYGWAAFSGKSVFSEPSDEEGEGNHPFLVYVEDHSDEGGDQSPADEFWIQVKDKDGEVVLEIRPDPDTDPDAPSDPAGEDGEDGDDTPIHNGNIVVPH